MAFHDALRRLPNLISLGRLFAVPIIVWLISSSEMALALWIFIAAGVSDAVDGFIAKRFDAASRLGSFIDPLADKALLVSCFVTLGIEGQISTWLVILVVFRDILIIGGVLLSLPLERPVIVHPLFISKLNTALQIILVALVLAKGGLGMNDGQILPIVECVVAATTFASGVSYAYRYVVAATEKDVRDSSSHTNHLGD